MYTTEGLEIIIKNTQRGQRRRLKVVFTSVEMQSVRKENELPLFRILESSSSHSV